MTSSQTFTTDFRARGRKAQAGATLMFSLVMTLIITIILVGVWNFVLSHVITAETTRSYSRAIHVAEAAANWQINKMSRVLPQGVTSYDLSGFIPFADFEHSYGFNSSTGLPLPSGDFNLPIEGNVRVQTLTTNNVPGGWTPGNNFSIRASGYDAERQIWRHLFFTGQPTGLADRYTLFGTNQLLFDGNTDTSVTCQLRGYIGSNKKVAWRQAPPALINVSGTRFGSCRLGMDENRNRAVLDPAGVSNWPTGMDAPRLPNRVIWPDIDLVTKYSFSKSPDTLASEGNPADQIFYLAYKDENDPSLGMEWKNLQDKLGQPITKLSNVEFKESQTPEGYRIIRLAAVSNRTNLFTFSDIDMKATDILLLDTNPADMLPIRILLHDPNNAGGTAKLTNLAYYSNTGATLDNTSFFHWYHNNPNKTLEYEPTISDNTGFSQPATDTAVYKVKMELRGLVYGGNTGDITVKGVSNTNIVKISSIIGRNVTIDTRNGKVRVEIPSAIDSPNDPRKFVLYYRIVQGYQETPSADPTEFDPRPLSNTYGILP